MKIYDCNITWYQSAASEGISLIANIAGTDGVVVGDSAVGIEATQTWTRVSAGLLDTCSGLTTLSTDQALWSAVRWRSNHSLLTGADADSIAFSELAVRSTWVGITRISLLYDWNSSGDQLALSDGISSVSQQTSADRLVSVSITNSIDTTHSWTRVNTLVVDTSFVGWTVSVEDTLWSAGQVGVSKVSWDTCTSSCSVS